MVEDIFLSAPEWPNATACVGFLRLVLEHSTRMAQCSPWLLRPTLLPLQLVQVPCRPIRQAYEATKDSSLHAPTYVNQQLP